MRNIELKARLADYAAAVEAASQIATTRLGASIKSTRTSIATTGG